MTIKLDIATLTANPATLADALKGAIEAANTVLAKQGLTLDKIDVKPMGGSASSEDLSPMKAICVSVGSVTGCYIW